MTSPRGFEADLGEGVLLTLRTPESAEPMHRLTVRNLDRLRRWEPWANDEQTIDSIERYTTHQLDQFMSGNVIPAMIVDHGIPIGSASLRMDRYLLIAELGCWVDRDAEGRGIVGRACSALIDHAIAHGMRRIEIRTAATNDRSRRVAERLGFQLEGTLRSALPIGETRLDVAVFGLVIAPDQHTKD
jgi:ribosomal-protein-serine acetyltransferase